MLRQKVDGQSSDVVIACPECGNGIHLVGDITLKRATPALQEFYCDECAKAFTLELTIRPDRWQDYPGEMWRPAR